MGLNINKHTKVISGIPASQLITCKGNLNKKMNLNGEKNGWENFYGQFIMLGN